MFSANITITIASPMISVIVSGIIREIAAAPIRIQNSQFKFVAK